MSEHEAIQPPAKFIKKWPGSYKPCPTCDGLMAKHALCCLKCNTKRPEVTQPADTTKRNIALTQGQVTTIDASEFERVDQWLWFAAKSESGKYYAARTAYRSGKGGERIMLHRFIMGATDPGIQIDHKNPEDTLNNTRENLRFANASLNGANRLCRPNISGYKGVTLLPTKPGKRRTDRWIAQIYFHRKRIYSPVFRDPILAARWYDAMAIKYFGEFAQLNFPEDWPHRS